MKKGKAINRYPHRATALLLTAELCACSGLPYQATQPAVNQCNQRFLQGDFGGAAALCAQGIQQDPNDWQAYSLRGQSYMKLGRFEWAAADFTRWSQLTPKAQQPFSWLASAQFYLGHYREAAEASGRALAVEERPDNRASRAIALLFAGRYADALADSQKALSETKGAPSEPTDVAMLTQASSLAALQRYQEALSVFDRYLASHPQGLIADGLAGSHLFFQGAAYFHLGRMQEARAIASRLIDAWPSYASIYFGDKAVEIFDTGARWAKVTKALETAEKAEQDAQWAEAFKILQSAWPARFPGTSQAVELERRMIALYPKINPKPEVPEIGRRFLVQAKSLVKDAEQAGNTGFLKAFQALNTFLTIVPWFPDAYYNRALIHVHFKEYDLAVQDMKNYLQLSPDAPDARAARDKIYEWEAKAK